MPIRTKGGGIHQLRRHSPVAVEPFARRSLDKIVAAGRAGEDASGWGSHPSITRVFGNRRNVSKRKKSFIVQCSNTN